MKFHILTWGCQMNDHDSEKLAGMLVNEGHSAVSIVEEADLVLLNTCSIREKAVHKVYTELGRLREIKLQRPLILGVTGCMAQQEKDAIFRRAPHVDFVLGTMAIRELPRLLELAIQGQKKISDTEEYPGNHLFPPELTQRSPTAKALITIIEGCDHHCTYCVVPLTRGPERHRPFGDVLSEVRGLVQKGFKEIELLGQNVNSYQGGCTFAELLGRVAEIDGLEWIRFTTSHPMNFTRELAHMLVTNPKVAPFLHLPVQSGSDAVLRRMGRQYTASDYLERLAYLGEGRERICLSTDFIVGFPGETDEDFDATMEMLEQVRFDASFSFAYSPRPGTPALRFKDDVPPKLKSQRLSKLQKRQTELSFQSNRRQVGLVLPVRVESQGPTDHGYWLARTGQWKNVHLLVASENSPRFGELVDARITEASPHFLMAELQD